MGASGAGDRGSFPMRCGGKDQDRRVGIVVADVRYDLNAVQPRHRQVGDDDIGPGLAKLLDGHLPIWTTGHHVDVFLRMESINNHLTDQVMMVQVWDPLEHC